MSALTPCLIPCDQPQVTATGHSSVEQNVSQRFDPSHLVTRDEAPGAGAGAGKRVVPSVETDPLHPLVPAGERRLECKQRSHCRGRGEV